MKTLLKSKYLYHYLNYIYQIGLTKYFQISSNGLMNLSFQRYKTISIPLPDINIQERIISSCDELIKKYNTVNMTLDKFEKSYKEIFQNNQIKILIDNSSNEDD